MLFPIELALVLFFLIFFSIISHKKKLLNFEGILIADVVGLAAITYGPNPLLCFFAVVVFFIIGEIASNYPRKKHDERNIWNVIGNSLPALIVLSLIVPYPEYGIILQLGFFGAVSAALADTLSSEIGYYSKSKPILITNFKKVVRGTDGGVTRLGELAGLFGSIIIASLYFIFIPNLFHFFILIGAGMIGTNMDSLMGAQFEIKKILNNTHVNLMGSSAGAIFALILILIL
ncbi:MAG: DUF92 domain-containing protein [Candidatus Diapherotrites archaeon]|jgi:uncharacterized protein (TIGR00297 family)|uniref:DUF92 domain-containing protein n=1 Tax=Candidatus Iainarchaeum sp. TaxID=3101447 RepID=A0A8T5GFE1_9ARCH|nr:DUF92 domain-containing protein [Candidatus Diapherotrites archaeon]MBT7241528.1 DUF92 domain-containing protein [Candidatus Diapherotrites archaeon]